MLNKMQTFDDFLNEHLAKTEAQQRLASVARAIADSVKQVAEMVANAPLAGQLGKLENENVQGEQQAKLDLLTNDCFVANLQACEAVAGMVSEEVEEAILLEKNNEKANYLVAFDPLDGSSNIEVNVAVGSIFSVLKAPVGRKAETADFLQKGKEQVLAGYGIFGPATILVISIGNGVYSFTLNRENNTFVCEPTTMRVLEHTKEFAINASNARFWEQPIAQYVQECQAGTTGVRGKDFNMRWIASMVADMHRILMRGGVYLYPQDNKVPLKAGRLRLLYEVNPMSWLIEQAGGASSTGRQRILDITPTDIHQRIAIIIGAKEEVEIVVKYHQDFDHKNSTKTH
jgi:fructose-1,6-bisphosphatase I / sedoheptulose-1,7-bisphosphatase